MRDWGEWEKDKSMNKNILNMWIWDNLQSESQMCELKDWKKITKHAFINV